jgi:sensor histidine kinase YesM
MKQAEMTIEDFSAADKKQQGRKFWLHAFFIYVVIETVYLVINYITAWMVCAGCRTTIAFAVSQWLLHLFFTACLWYVLSLIHRLRLPLRIVANIFVFIVYYFLWQLLYFNMVHSEIGWLTGRGPTAYPFRVQVQFSWFEIGKYMLKLTAFYTLMFYYEYKIAERQRMQLAMVNKDMQLNLLKQQLSPHFYFNTLNNLYGLARSNSGKLSLALHQLSDIMRYVLDDCNKPKVLLSQEINFLQSYIALEKLRYEQQTIIDMQVRGTPTGQTILPMLLIQFVENAFKHGMKEKAEHSWMKVRAEIDRNLLLFSVDNSAAEARRAEGIGISSVKHILDLQYEGKYDLNMQQADGFFSVTLKLNLS